jgi:hypothetical protein
MEAGVSHVEQGGLSLSLVLYNSHVVEGLRMSDLRSAARTHVQKWQVLNSKYFRKL